MLEYIVPLLFAALIVPFIAMNFEDKTFRVMTGLSGLFAMLTVIIYWFDDRGLFWNIFYITAFASMTYHSIDKFIELIELDQDEYKQTANVLKKSILSLPSERKRQHYASTIALSCLSFVAAGRETKAFQITNDDARINFERNNNV